MDNSVGVYRCHDNSCKILPVKLSTTCASLQNIISDVAYHIENTASPVGSFAPRATIQPGDVINRIISP